MASLTSVKDTQQSTATLMYGVVQVSEGKSG